MEYSVLISALILSVGLWACNGEGSVPTERQLSNYVQGKDLNARPDVTPTNKSELTEVETRRRFKSVQDSMERVFNLKMPTYEERVRRFGENKIESGVNGQISWEYIGSRTGSQDYGVIKWSNGVTYEGSWRNNKRNGFGKQTWDDGTTYYGEFVDNKIHGKGVLITPGISLYVGSFSDGEKNGFGIFRLNNNKTLNTCNGCRRYEGYYLNGQKHSGSSKCFSSAYGGELVYSGGFANDKPIEQCPNEN